MSNEKHYKLFNSSSAQQWSEFRKNNPKEQIDLSNIRVAKRDIVGYNFIGVNFYGSHFLRCSLLKCDFRGANMGLMDIKRCDLRHINITPEQLPHLMFALGINVIFSQKQQLIQKQMARLQAQQAGTLPKPRERPLDFQPPLPQHLQGEKPAWTQIPPNPVPLAREIPVIDEMKTDDINLENELFRKHEVMPINESNKLIDEEKSIDSNELFQSKKKKGKKK